MKASGSGWITMFGVVMAAALSHPSPLRAQALFHMEGGMYTKTDTYVNPVWDTIHLQHTYVHPAVFMVPASNGGHPADFRFRNITSTSFETTTVEPPGWDGPHIAMTVAYIVAEAGGWFLTSNRYLYVGFVQIDNIVNSEEAAWREVLLPQGFSNPIVLAQIQEMANEQNNLPLEISKPWFTAAVRNVTASSFEVALDGGRCTNVSTSSNPDCVGPYDNLLPETVAYLVIEGNVRDEFVDATGTTIRLETILTGPTILGWNDGGTQVPFLTSPPFSTVPLFVAKPQSRFEADGGWFRYSNLTTTSVRILIDEAVGDTGPRSQAGGVGEIGGALLFSENFTVEDLDPDKDLVPVPNDNCPFIYNPQQEDADADGEGDACDCGDGLVVASEHCDDGNLVNGDGCSDRCVFEPGWWCTGEPSLCDGICGDGIVVGTEVCDDGNTTDGDACASDCHSFCGDGVRNGSHGETCDGTDLGGETCTSIGLGFTGGTLACDATCRFDLSGCTLCGNGAVESGEECDDGNNVSGDGCSSDCAFESGWNCSGDPTLCVPLCGDGRILGSEACDDGDATDNDGCSDTCTVEPGWTCAGEPSVCETVCGDGLLLPGEECDDGNAIDGDGCSAACTVEPGWTCSGDTTPCQPVCGDGRVQAGEACDDGNGQTGDGCTPECTVESGWQCAGDPSFCVPRCGDGVMMGDEACDDGNALGGDGCSGTCQLEPGWSCTGEPSVCSASCGDGWVVDGELCDDGNLEPGDGCDPTCRVEAGFVCTGNPSRCEPRCGNGELEAGEACDDHNHASGDGCSAECEIEPGFLCAGNPSVCCRDANEDGACDDLHDFYVGSGGGCYCRSGDGGGFDAPLALLLLGLFLVRRRRRGMSGR